MLATSFGCSQLQPLLLLLEAMPEGLHFTVPYLLSFVLGDPVKMATVNIDNMLPPREALEQLSVNLASLLHCLSGLADIIPKETLLWKLKLLKSAASYTNSRFHAVNAEVLLLARLFCNASGSVLFSTLDDGKIVRGLSGIPSEGPVLSVGYHMLMGLELYSLVDEF